MDVRALLGDDSKWLLQPDFENAFNLVDRIKMMVEIRTHLSDISYWVESIYGAEDVLNMGDASILSSAWVHQGNPLAYMLFSLALLPLEKRLAREIPNLVTNEWFLDDGALGGRQKDLLQAVDILRQ